jgi:uncharacterized protein
MMRLVLDTNTFVAAGFNLASSSAKIMAAIRRGELELVWNEDTRRETRAVLDQIPPLNWDGFSDLFSEENRFTGETHPQDFPHVLDADDRKFAALAAATGAVLISNDDHLLSVRDQMPFRTLTPGELMREGW